MAGDDRDGFGVETWELPVLPAGPVFVASHPFRKVREKDGAPVQFYGCRRSGSKDSFTPSHAGRGRF
jgi:hypothetical protein